MVNAGARASLDLSQRAADASARRLITADEVYDAVRTELLRNGVRGASSLRRQDVQLNAQVFVRRGDAGLRVARMDVDPILERARFLLQAVNDPELVPFLATARLDAASLAQLGHRELNISPQFTSTLRKREMFARAASAAIQPILVHPGQQAILTMSNATMRITVQVVPLERGSMG